MTSSVQQRRRPVARGMTLVEVLAVVVLLGLLASVLAVGVRGAFGKGKQELAKTGIGILIGKVEMYRLETSSWPSLEEGLAVLSDGQAEPSEAYYLAPDALRDPWNNPYHYVTPGPNGHPFEILSYGADGQPGGEGEDADERSTALRGLVAGVGSRALSGATSDQVHVDRAIADIAYADKLARATARSRRPVRVQLDGRFVSVHSADEAVMVPLKISPRVTVRLEVEGGREDAYTIDARGQSADVWWIVQADAATEPVEIAGLTGWVTRREQLR